MFVLEEKLRLLHDDLTEMFALVEQMVRRAVDQLESPTDSGAAEIVRLEQVANTFDVRIEQRCLDILALQQPVARDLRQITTTLRVVTGLERVADLGVNLARRSANLGDDVQVVVPEKMRKMTDIATGMLHDAIQSYIRGDVELAENVRQRDDEVDDLNREIIADSVDTMHSDSAQIDAMLHLFSASRLIERIGDHATNIAEETISLVRAKIVRHQHEAG